MKETSKFPMIKGLCSLMLLVGTASTIVVSVTEVFDIAGQIDTAKSIIDLIYDLSKAENPQDALQKFLGQDKVEEKLDQITFKINQLSGKIDNLGSQLSMKIDDVAISIITRLKNDNRLTISEYKIVEWMLDVKNWYNQYREYRNLTFGYPSMSIGQFATDVTNVHAKSSIEKLFQYTIPGGTGVKNFKGIIQLILTEAQDEAKETCGHGISKHQELYNLYVSIMMTETKYCIIATYAYKQLAKRHPTENYFNEFQRLLNDFDRRARGYLAAFRAGMKSSLRSIRACDPAIQVKGETYLELERLFGPYVINEYDMHVVQTHVTPELWGGNALRDNCASTCEEKGMDRRMTACQKGFCHDDRHFCRGKLQNCRTANNIEFCMRSDFKRYEAIKVNDQLYGGELTCSDSRKKTAGTWIRPGGNWVEGLQGVWSCDTCLCTCAYDETANGDAPLRIHNEMIHADENNVITGVKFDVIKAKDRNGKKYNLLHLKIRQGLLRKRGKIIHDSWKSPPTTITGSPLKINIGGLDSDTAQAAILIKINAPKGYVIIGVGFQRFSDFNSFGIRVRAAKVNFDTGELNKNHIWDSGEPGLPNLTELTLKNPDSPLKSPRNILDSNDRENVRFQMSDLEKDVGASTVPFFDLQSVLTTPAFPLSSVGLIHRGREGFGGFIAPTIDTYEFSDDIKLPPPPITFVT